ncbi:MAG: EVE domain-containing protein [Candidatus Eisenbacteria bacterium]|uniref:EVE domain-containing protein n=1 Tax=Eiseniibacteriota bacterium TaxID=2212470 RepID=A0A7Y2E7Z0_UNCEI|nr:EVE domain-containing protein [Candidatus Eisenbacteria bacterium]
MAKNYWLMKSEPDVFGWDDLIKRPKKTEPWDGVRNYQARNIMRDKMEKGDLVFFYHSNFKPPHIAGIAKIVRESYPDPTQFDPESHYFDPKATAEKPRWVVVDVEFVAHFEETLTLEELKADPQLEGMLVTRKGQRLSIQPVEAQHWRRCCRLARLDPKGL